MGIRQKFMLGFLALLLVIAVIGGLTTVQLRYLGKAVDTVLQENYRSVAACQDMTEALDRLDSGLLFILAGDESRGRGLLTTYQQGFAKALEREKNNITLPGEAAAVDSLSGLYTAYTIQVQAFINTNQPGRHDLYFNAILSLFGQLKHSIYAVRELNQQHMSLANQQASHIAHTATQRQFWGIIITALLACLFYWLSKHWLLNPVQRLIDTAEDISHGNYDVALPGGANDEIGRLTRTFNAMSESLRKVRRAEKQGLLRTRKATEEAFKMLPAAVMITDLAGVAEVVNETAHKVLGLQEGQNVKQLALPWLAELHERAWRANRKVEYRDNEGLVQLFCDNREFFFQPVAMPIPAGADEVTGVMIVLKDMTQVQEQQELKRSVVSTVSHQLKTPLTSLRMSLHLLMDWRTGPTTVQQKELLTAARDDSERLVSIVDDLLNLSRLESGSSPLERNPVQPRMLVDETLAESQNPARDAKIALENRVAPDLPVINADAGRIKYVLANLVSNALRHTGAGGTLVVRVVEEESFLRFSVTDTGRGIPQEYQPFVFDPFFRAPDQENHTGVGLGLTIAREIILNHGGQIGLESEPGQGTVVWFTLPKNQ